MLMSRDTFSMKKKIEVNIKIKEYYFKDVLADLSNGFLLIARENKYG